MDTPAKERDTCRNSSILRKFSVFSSIIVTAIRISKNSGWYCTEKVISPAKGDMRLSEHFESKGEAYRHFWDCQ